MCTTVNDGKRKRNKAHKCGPWLGVSVQKTQKIRALIRVHRFGKKNIQNHDKDRVHPNRKHRKSEHWYREHAKSDHG